MRNHIIVILLAASTSLFAQKKPLDHSDFDIWNTIEGEVISPDGNYVAYSLKKGERDNSLRVHRKNGKILFKHDRSENAKFTFDSNFVLFTIKPWSDSLRVLKSRKTKKKDLPKDSLGILNLNDGVLTKKASLKSYKIPKRWSGYAAYQLHKQKANTKTPKDTLLVRKKQKKPSKSNGYHLVIRNLLTYKEDTIKFVTDYHFAEKSKKLVYTSTGPHEASKTGVFVKNLESGHSVNLHNSLKGKYHQLQVSSSGKHVGFVVDTDTTKIQMRPNTLFYWKEGDTIAGKIMSTRSSPKGYQVSPHGKVHFSEKEDKMFFGFSTPPIRKDTTLTDEEIVNVEVWTYNEPRLYTVQEFQLKNDTIKSYTAFLNLKKLKTVQLADTIYPNIELADEGNCRFALTSTQTPYELESQWNARVDSDYRIIDTETGKAHFEIKKVPYVKLSPKGRYAYGYNSVDTTWFTVNLKTKKRIDLTKGEVFYDELNDIPFYPYPYGAVGWTKNDEHLYLYDRFDIWQFDPDTGARLKITDGRMKKTSYRYNTLNDELRHLPSRSKWILTTFNEATKDGGYASFDPKSKELTQLVTGPFQYSSPQKALFSDDLIFTKESFQEFPNLWLSSLNFNNKLQLSNANPQQENYNWGTVELFEWSSLDGKPLQGLLVKPENFDATKKYPLLVNFYERSSDNLNKHRAPKAERSSINYSFYTSRGYVIFNPDVHYRIGYPGESAYNCVIPGVTSLIEKGFIDEDNIGTQGHSWGGYQIAYLVTKTDIFKAAESGAPVPNMISAYGGIRWGSGLSRQFQYEHTQSRIGGTPWEYPQRYIENSPIFNLDKINTPLLIMHNDADGHVPWYQGIEFFVGLRRLGKPSWFLNYNGEPHWPLKLQNRKDFNIRMAQFFDHYLKGAPQPSWMKRGVPAIEKGILQGYQNAEKTKKP